MELIPTELPGVVVLAPRVHRDGRGAFLETWRAPRYAALGLPDRFAQDNLSVSAPGVLRGLHLQWPAAQAKLVWAAAGAVWDVAVDLRRGSPTFGRWAAVELTAAEFRQVFIPAGFGHGFVVTSEGPGGGLLQGHRRVRPNRRADRRLGRPRPGDHLAAARPDPLRQGPRRAAAPRHPRRPAPPLQTLTGVPRRLLGG
jgi:dTDP-4-dehydrorhamnose 3,5-epimerase